MMPAKQRALCRILYQRKHGVISDEMWQSLLKMESHYEKRMSKAESKTIQDMAVAAKAMSGSEESVERISIIYCIVSQPSSILSQWFPEPNTLLHG